MRAVTLAVTLLTCTALGAGCGGTQSPTAASSTTVSTTTELFFGTLAPQGSSFYSYSVSHNGTVSVTLASVTAGTRSVSGTSVGLGLGIPAGTGCSVTTSLNTTAALTAQLTSDATAGVYCVDVFDAGSMAAPLNFAVRIVHP